jgi:hypothetical protein
MQQSGGPDANGYSWSFDNGESASVSVRAKAGAPLGSALVYIAAGFQYIHTFSRYESTDVGDTYSGRGQRSGTTVALGVEYPILPTLSLKGEAGLNGYWSDADGRYGGHHAKIGLNYYFD